MNHSTIDKMVKQWIVDAADRPANPRIQAITVRLVGDLCKAIEDLDISQTEFWKGLEFLQEAGKRHELGLIAPGLGLERFLDDRADEADAKAGVTSGTQRCIEGPLYVAGAPESVGVARMDDGTETDKAETLFIEGIVFGEDGKPIANAKVEAWHANTHGSYSFFDKTQSTFNLRRTVVTDAQGRYTLQTIVPTGYGCPPGGSTEAWLNQLGRHGHRPAHVHFFVTAPGHRKLTTQFNIAGDKLLGKDFAFADYASLVPPVKHVADSAEQAKRKVNKPFALINFDFRVVKDKAKAAEGLVDRMRAAA